MKLIGRRYQHQDRWEWEAPSGVESEVRPRISAQRWLPAAGLSLLPSFLARRARGVRKTRYRRDQSSPAVSWRLTRRCSVFRRFSRRPKLGALSVLLTAVACVSVIGVTAGFRATTAS